MAIKFDLPVKVKVNCGWKTKDQPWLGTYLVIASGWTDLIENNDFGYKSFWKNTIFKILSHINA